MVTKAPAPSFPSAKGAAVPEPPPSVPVDRSTTAPATEAGAAPEPAPDAVTVLVVDDEPSNIESLERIFLRDGMRVLSAPDARRALEMVRSHRVNVVLTDLMMPGTTGLELLRAVRQVAPDVEVVLMTAYGSVEAAVTAMREGAYDFVEKPLKRLSITKSVRKAAEKQRLVAENRSLKDELKRLAHREIVGSSPALRRVIDVATQAAPSSATVLVLGESGTGKELLARYIHEKSARPSGPFVAVNCAAIPETILESELFGHERGAFTGATSRKDGRFARASGGTLFLDEIGEALAFAVQVKLLRVLQEWEYEPVGGKTQKADVLIVAETNRDNVAELAAGRFREDLYYRLNVIAVVAPPLRARREDIPLLVDHFLGKYCAKNGRPRLQPTRGVIDRLADYAWPGNVRELENVIERAVVLARSDTLTEADLPEHMSASEPTASQLTFEIGTPLEEIELRVIRETLRRTRGDKSVAAQLLGISTRTIYRKLDGISE